MGRDLTSTIIIFTDGEGIQLDIHGEYYTPSRRESKQGLLGLEYTILSEAKNYERTVKPVLS